MKIFSKSIEEGAERITIADTAGAAIPPAVNYLVSQVVNRFNVPVQVHFHNDFGLGMSNALAAIEAGASIVDVTVNGLGERAGNVSMDELVIVLNALYGMDLHIEIQKLGEISRHIENLTKVPIPRHKPLMGKEAFTHKLDAHVRGVLTHPPLYEVISPQSIGNKRIIPVGKYSGPFTIRAKLHEFDISASDEEINEIVKEVENKSIDQHASLTDKEFLSVVRNITGSN
jgi:2-isopropylmalate synthase